MDIEILQPGSRVYLERDIEATILNVNISLGWLVSYECSWWNERERKTGWFFPCEILKTKTGKEIKVGFEKGTTDEHQGSQEKGT